MPLQPVSPRLPGHRFSLEISLAPALGRPLPCLLRACKLASDNVLVTCEPEQGERIPEMEMGRALTRGLDPEVTLGLVRTMSEQNINGIQRGQMPRFTIP